jgi:hypothetical protein
VLGIGYSRATWSVILVFCGPQLHLTTWTYFLALAFGPPADAATRMGKLLVMLAEIWPATAGRLFPGYIRFVLQQESQSGEPYWPHVLIRRERASTKDPGHVTDRKGGFWLVPAESKSIRFSTGTEAPQGRSRRNHRQLGHLQRPARIL